MGRVLGDLSTSSGSQPGLQPSKGIVLIHGGGIWKPDYWQPIVDAIKKMIEGEPADKQFGAVGVHYSDVISAHTPSDSQPTPLASAFPQFRNTFLNELLRDQLMATAIALSPAQLLQKITATLLPGGASLLAALSATSAMPGFTKTSETFLDILTHALFSVSLSQARDKLSTVVLPGGANVAATLQDVYQYLYNENFASQVRQRLIDGLHEAQKYDQVVLVSHSLGAVVAFDVLNEWTESTPKISHWFTLGCPLTKVLRLRPGTPNRLKNEKVTHWFNVYDSTDPIGGALGPTFTKPGYSIYDIFVDIAKDPIASHDYFDNVTTLGIIAGVIHQEA